MTEMESRSVVAEVELRDWCGGRRDGCGLKAGRRVWVMTGFLSGTVPTLLFGL